ncbi:hypothetical protein IJS77_04620 [bacterium]|nr:hypothetical protein [bacterium]
MYKKIKAFTLAEAIATLVLLGVVVALTVPAALNNASVRSNRLKLQKAATVYQQAIESMIVENELPRDEDVIDQFAAENDCQAVREYFRVSSTVGDNPCRFLSVNEIYWDFGSTDDYSLTSPLVSFNENNFNKNSAESDEYTAFIMTTSISDDGGIHVNDVGYEENSGSEKYWHAKKIACFMNKERCKGEDYKVKED